MFTEHYDNNNIFMPLLNTQTSPILGPIIILDSLYILGPNPTDVPKKGNFFCFLTFNYFNLNLVIRLQTCAKQTL